MSRVPAGDLLAGLPAEALADERFEDLLRAGPVRIERIVSTGQRSPEGFWYDQDWDEFVLLVAGAATLQIEGEPDRALAPGAWVMLPAGTRHRVAATAADRPTVWLAVHIGEPADPQPPSAEIADGA